MSFFDDLFDSLSLDPVRFNQMKIRHQLEQLEANAAARDQRDRPRSNEADEQVRWDELERTIGHLALVNQALVKVLEESGVLDGQKLIDAMVAIDAQDGVVDGQVTPERLRPEPSRHREPQADSEAMKLPVVPPDGTVLCTACGKALELDPDLPSFCYFCGAPLEPDVKRPGPG